MINLGCYCMQGRVTTIRGRPAPALHAGHAGLTGQGCLPLTAQSDTISFVAGILVALKNCLSSQEASRANHSKVSQGQQ